MLPKDFPPMSTVQGYFYDWRDSALWPTINHLIVMRTRELEGREASPTAGVIDSQSVKTTESGVNGGVKTIHVAAQKSTTSGHLERAMETG